MTMTADTAKPKRRKGAQPLPKPPTPAPKGKRKPATPRDLKADSPGRYVTKDQAGPGDDDDQEQAA